MKRQKRHRRPGRPSDLQVLPACCLRHRAAHVALLEALRTPPGLCLLCGRQATHRGRWPADARSALTVPSACGVTPLQEVYVDVCPRCRRLPDLEVRVDAALVAARQTDLEDRRN